MSWTTPASDVRAGSRRTTSAEGSCANCAPSGEHQASAPVALVYDGRTPIHAPPSPASLQLRTSTNPLERSCTPPPPAGWCSRWNVKAEAPAVPQHGGHVGSWRPRGRGHVQHRRVHRHVQTVPAHVAQLHASSPPHPAFSICSSRTGRISMEMTRSPGPHPSEQASGQQPILPRIFQDLSWI